MLVPDKESPPGETAGFKVAQTGGGVQVNYGSPELPSAMAISELPEPPYPDKIGSKPNKAGGYVFELDVDRMHQSDTWVIADACQRPLLLMLWVASWAQVPCGTLPDNDAVIAARVGLPLPKFKASKDVLMRGWWKASDGRLYHPVITEQVVAMMARKAKGAARQREFRERHAGGKPDSDGEVTRDPGATDDAVARNSTVSQSPTTTTTTKTKEQDQKHLPGPQGPSRRSDACESDVGIEIPLKGGGEHVISNTEVREWEQVFPDKDVLGELRRARLWCVANPAKQKTRTGIRRFLNGWLARTTTANAPPIRRTAQAAHTGFNQIDYQKDADEWNAKI